MSEFQYYEFQAIDRPLTRPEMAELRKYSTRALYLGWLVRLQSGELEDDDVEPPVPAGLGQLSGALQAMAEFLRIDDELLQVAAERSVTPESPKINRPDIVRKVRALPSAVKDEALADYFMGRATRLTTLQQRVRQDRPFAPGNDDKAGKTVSEIRRAAGLS